MEMSERLKSLVQTRKFCDEDLLGGHLQFKSGPEDAAKNC